MTLKIPKGGPQSARELAGKTEPIVPYETMLTSITNSMFGIFKSIFGIKYVP